MTCVFVYTMSKFFCLKCILRNVTAGTYVRTFFFPFDMALQIDLLSLYVYLLYPPQRS